ncbi:hypothetical protein MMPV_006960 [Pyropia vietnamensis]
MAGAWTWLLASPQAFWKDIANFRDVYDFYLSYHQTPANLAIHSIAVPTLTVAILLLLAATTSFTADGDHHRHGIGKACHSTFVGLDAGAAIIAVYLLYYATVVPALAPFAAGIFATLWAAARTARMTFSSRRKAVGAALALGTVAEAAMVFGHRVLEEDSHAVIHGPAKALAGAPLAIYVELALRAGWFSGVLHGGARGAAAAAAAAAVA